MGIEGKNTVSKAVHRCREGYAVMEARMQESKSDIGEKRPLRIEEAKKKIKVNLMLPWWL